MWLLFHCPIGGCAGRQAYFTVKEKKRNESVTHPLIPTTGLTAQPTGIEKVRQLSTTNYHWYRVPLYRNTPGTGSCKSKDITPRVF